MHVDLTLFVALIAIAVGFVAFWSNPKRSINFVFLTLSLQVALWLGIHTIALRSSDGLFCREAIVDLRINSGLRRLEMQVLLLGGSAAALTLLAVMAWNSITRGPRYLWLQPVVILLFYTATVIAITTHRIFNARQLL